MARARVPITVIDLLGNAVLGAQVFVKIRATGATATVYQAETGGTTLSNPIVTNSQGIADGWVERGAYYADITGTGITGYRVDFEAGPAKDAGIDDLWLPVEARDARSDAIEARLDIIEGRKQAFDIASGGALTLGTYAGNTITGIHFLIVGLMSGSAGHAFYIKPNGLATIQAEYTAHRVYWPGGGPVTGDLQGGAIATRNGMNIGAFDWITPGANEVWMKGTLWTRTGRARTYIGDYVNKDATSDGNRMLHGDIVSNWHDTSTAITSISLGHDGTNFVGRIITETF
jgi:hypothetical protein